MSRGEQLYKEYKPRSDRERIIYNIGVQVGTAFTAPIFLILLASMLPVASSIDPVGRIVGFVGVFFAGFLLFLGITRSERFSFQLVTQGVGTGERTLKKVKAGGKGFWEKHEVSA
jgi:hypothetical protein